MKWQIRGSRVRIDEGGCARSRRLREARRIALSAAVVAKARYLAAVDEPSVNPSAVARLKARWLDLEARKNALQMASVASEPPVIIQPAYGSTYQLL